MNTEATSSTITEFEKKNFVKPNISLLFSPFSSKPDTQTSVASTSLSSTFLLDSGNTSKQTEIQNGSNNNPSMKKDDTNSLIGNF